MDLNIDLPLFAAAKINNSGDTEDEEEDMRGTFHGADDEDWSDDSDEEDEIYGSMFDEE
ncbi:MAG: hypothetical protein HUT38_00220 [Candidatus Paceibacter sp.]|nr:hypothetical protein [Candidatus Paceibacter sp.]